LFASQDPVAIESVGVDFFAAEKTAKLMVGAADNYLHEAALAERPGISSWDLTLRLDWSRPFDEIAPFMQRTANGETLAHLVLLERRGTVRRQPGVPAGFYLTDDR